MIQVRNYSIGGKSGKRMSTYPEGVFVVSTAGEVKDATGELKLKPV